MEPLCVQIISAVPINQKLYSSAEKVWGEVCVTKRNFLRWAGVTKRTNVAGSNLLVLQDDMFRKSGNPVKRPFNGDTVFISLRAIFS